MTPLAIAAVLVALIVGACVLYALRLLEWWLVERTKPAAHDALVQLRNDVTQLRAEVDSLKSRDALRGL